MPSSSSNIENQPIKFQGKEWGAGNGVDLNLYDFGARRYDPSIGRWLSQDPLMEKYYYHTPYLFCAANPISIVDPDGTSISTHTDFEGNVVFVKDDGDNGVYRHSGNKLQARREVLSQYSLANTSAGGDYMGESLHSLSFADMNIYHETGLVKEAKNMKISFFSKDLTRAVEAVMASGPGIIEYALKAHPGGIWDLKSKHRTGSLLYGKYASPRDAGNFLAGMFSASKGPLSGLIDYGYGVFNASGNNAIKSAGIVLSNMVTPPLMKTALYEHYKNEGEDELSKKVQLLGEEYYKDNY